MSESRDKCKQDFELFCMTYLADSFTREFTVEQSEFAEQLRDVVNRRDGLRGKQMPRGSGKTTLSQAAALWLALYGHREFVLNIVATAVRAGGISTRLMGWMDAVGRLRGDFSDVSVLIQPWRNELIIGRRDGRTIVSSCSVFGAFRGAERRGDSPFDAAVRPDFLLIDDALTADVANSPSRYAEYRRAMGYLTKMADVGGGMLFGSVTGPTVEARVISESRLCETCRYFKPGGDGFAESGGECRRNPPQTPPFPPPIVMQASGYDPTAEPLQAEKLREMIAETETGLMQVLPHGATIKMMQPQGVWPAVRGEDWCGEWEQGAGE